jgi:hypothetical protein
MKAAKTGSRILTLVLATPPCKGAGPALGFRLTPRSRTLWTQESTSTMLNYLGKVRSGQVGPGYNHILIFRYRSGWIRWLKNVRRRCAPVKPPCHNC